MPGSNHLARAQALLKRGLLLDGHNDLPWVIRADRQAKGDVAAYGVDRVHQEGDTDIPRLREGKVAAQIFAAFLPTDIAKPATVTLEQIDLIRRMEALHADTFLPVRRSSDIARAKRLGKIAVITSVEGTVGLEGSLAPLRIWHALGVRLVTLCHNGSLPWIDSATDAPRCGGLSEFGRAIVVEMNRLGLIVDLSHVAPAAMHQVLDVAKAPLVLSHSNARTLCNHPRNVPDDVLDRIPASGGVVMATFIPPFTWQPRQDWERPFQNEHGAAQYPGGERPDLFAAHEREVGAKPAATLEHVADHLDYLKDRIGEDHVGIGSDFFGGPRMQGLEDVSRFPHLFAELLRRGWSERALHKLASRNFLRVFRACEREMERRLQPPKSLT